MKHFSIFWRKGLWALLSLGFVGLVGFIALYIYASSELPDVDSLKTVQLQVPLRIYSRDGQLIQEYGEKKRIPVDYQDIPPLLIHALLATEDQRFFEHPGVDIMGLGRAAVNMVATGSKSQGGSTITMQVARNFFLSRKKTFFRKFNEILLAIKIDRELSKEKILELYLNKIYLGNRAYGVGAAAMVYYGKSLKELNLAQLAMIAGLPQAPSSQNPIANPLAAKKRRDHVLERLLEEKYITEDQYQEAISQPITAKYHAANIEVSAPYVAEMIRQSLISHFGQDAYTKGYKVYTTIDGKLQNAANEVVENHLLAYDRRHGYRGPVANIGISDSQSPDARHKILLQYPTINDLQSAVITSVEPESAHAVLVNGQAITLNWQALSWARPALRKGWVGRAPTTASQVVRVGDVVYVRHDDAGFMLTQLPQIEAALVSLDPANGAIRAMTGGFNFRKSKFNRATQSGRQPGSSFKPFIYAAALDKGYTLATLINDAPITVEDPSQEDLWRPQNVNHDFAGPMRFREALVRSRNTVSIRILDDIGILYAVDYLTRFGFDKKSMPKALSLVLGSLSVSPLEMAAAYAVFANGGFKVEPYLIDRITDDDGKVVLQAKPSIACPRCDATMLQNANLAPQVISEDVAFLMNSVLRDVIKRGTARRALSLNRKDIGGKTGSTNKQIDAWFAGFSPALVTTVWVGYDEPRSIHEYGAQVALPIWIDYMNVALKGVPESEYPMPDDIVSVRIDPKTGLLATPDDTQAIYEYFREHELPSQDFAYSSDQE